MTTFEQVKAQVEGLWTKELADLRREREEVESRAAEAWLAAEEHQGRAGVLSGQLAEARSELGELPGKLAAAMLEDDQGEIVALQGRFAALKATTAEQDQALEAEHARIGEDTLALQEAEASGHDLAVKENEAKMRLWDEFESLESRLLHHFARAVGAERLPTFIASEREAYHAAVHRQAGRLGKPKPGGIVVLRAGAQEAPPDTVRPSQLAPMRG